MKIHTNPLQIEPAVDEIFTIDATQYKAVLMNDDYRRCNYCEVVYESHCDKIRCRVERSDHNCIVIVRIPS